MAQRTSFLAVASCGLLPRTTRPGPRVRTAFWSVAILPLRDTRASWTWAPQAGRPFISSGCGLKYSVLQVSGPTQAECHPELAKDPHPSARRDELRILRLRSQARFAQDDTALRNRGRPGPG